MLLWKIVAKAISSAKKNGLRPAPCLHGCRLQSVLFHRAKARARDEAKRNRVSALRKREKAKARTSLRKVNMIKY